MFNPKREKQTMNSYRNTFINAVATFTLSLMFMGASQAQEKIPVPLDDPSRPATVKLGQVSGSITVKGYEGKEVIVEAKARNESEKRHRRDSEGAAEGMKKLSIGSTGLEIDEENNVVRISTASHMRPIDVTISVPTRSNLILSTVNDGDISVSNVEGELDLNDVNGDVTVTNCAGSVVAHALNGKLQATLTRVNGKPMAFSSLNGDIDVTFPADFKATVSFASDRGDVFSDFDVVMSSQNMKPVVQEKGGEGGRYRVKLDKTVRGTINGGGPEIQFKNFNGAIYIRKAGARSTQ
jgi:hypothetical protein